METERPETGAEFPEETARPEGTPDTAGLSPAEEESPKKNTARDPDRRPHKKRPNGKKRRRDARRKAADRTMAAVNAVLLLLTGIALALCGWAGYRYVSFSPETYDSRVAELTAETDRVREDIRALEESLEEENERLRSDLALSGEEGKRAAEELSAAKAENETLLEENAALKERAEFLSDIRNNTTALREEYAGKIRRLEDKIVAGESDVKICYWSFDDGPGLMTSAILDFCEENGVYVTFFTSREANETGQGDVDEPALLRRETMLGNSVQNHTNSHQYSRIAGNLYTQGIDSFREQVRLQDEWILENTGFKPDIFRFPGGSAWAYNLIPKEELLGALDALGYKHVDWACDVMDNLHSNPDAGIVYTRATWQIKQIDPPIAIILSHDWNINTYYGFMRAVPAIRDMGYIFLPLFSQSWAIDNTVIRFS